MTKAALHFENNYDDNYLFEKEPQSNFQINRGILE